MLLALVRIDDRLIHGQVVLNWVRTLRPAGILVVDDDLAGDPTARAILRGAAPPGLAFDLVTVAGAAASLTSAAGGRGARAELLVLVRDPRTAQRLYAAGLRFAALNVGCLGMAPGRVRVHAQVSLTPQEREILSNLASLGVDVFLQALPTAPRVRLADLAWPRREEPRCDDSRP